MKSLFGLCPSWGAALLVCAVLGSTVLSAGFYFRPRTAPAEPHRLMLPESLNTDMGRLVRLEAQTNGRVVWIVSPSDKNRIDSQGTTDALLLVLRVPGTYHVGAVSILDGELLGPLWTRIECLAPTPPVPPPPPKPPTPPVDPFTYDLGKAWEEESEADKVLLPGLIALYKNAARVTVHDPKLTHVKQLNDTLLTARIALVGEGLPKIRKIISREVTLALSGGQPDISVDAVLDPTTRDVAALTLGRVAKALGDLP